jgi:hypothetical protein
MAHGSREVVELLVTWAVTTAWAFAIVIGDEKDLDEEELGNAWPPSSRAIAIVGISWLVLPLHFARTRGGWRSFRAFGWKLVWLCIGLGCVVGAAIECDYVISALLWVVEALGIGS